MITTPDNEAGKRAKNESLASLASSFRRDSAIIKRFVQIVERQAESRMLLTGKLAAVAPKPRYGARREGGKAPTTPR